MGTVRDRFDGTVRFKGGLSCKGRINSVIIDLITYINELIGCRMQKHVHNQCTESNY